MHHVLIVAYISIKQSCSNSLWGYQNEKQTVCTHLRKCTPWLVSVWIPIYWIPFWWLAIKQLPKFNLREIVEQQTQEALARCVVIQWTKNFSYHLFWTMINLFIHRHAISRRVRLLIALLPFCSKIWLAAGQSPLENSVWTANHHTPNLDAIETRQRDISLNTCSHTFAHCCVWPVMPERLTKGLKLTESPSHCNTIDNARSTEIR